jgi:hypothetical protein
MKLLILLLLFNFVLAFNGCDVCEDLVGIIEGEMKIYNSSINIIEKVMHDVCETIIIKPEREECLTIVNDIHNITQWIMDGLYPKDICIKLGLCPNQTYYLDL